ncbi:hypothetical protein VNO78_10093 [Psophocarpus tetragonolobus]|uniref:Uncharacterized protein n=1 Tax=Psophocarpus tetragonolobus TaxID=3891 RepID=A0AAN9XMG3_PSOTE
MGVLKYVQILILNEDVSDESGVVHVAVALVFRFFLLALALNDRDAESVHAPSCRNIVMNSPHEDNISETRELGSPDASSNDNGNFLSFYGEQFACYVFIHVVISFYLIFSARHRLLLVHWLTSLVPSLHLPINVTDGELRACLSNGTLLCQILNKQRPGTVIVVSEPDNFLPSQSENVKTFLKALDGMGLPRFEISDLEKGSMKAVVNCLLTLREKGLHNALGDNISVTNSNTVIPGGNAPISFHCSPTFAGEQRKVSAGSTKLQRVMSTPVMAESSASLIHHVGHNFHEVFQLKPGSYADLPAAKISEMMKSNSIDTLMLQNAPTQSLLSVVNGILEESVERRNGEIPHRVACLLRKVTQEIERRMSTQAEHLRTQNNLFKAREEKYQSRIRVLEALASGTRDESEICASQFQQLKKIKDEELEISALKVELETAKRTYELQLAQLEEAANRAKAELTQKAQEYEHQLEELRNKIEEEVKMADEVESFRLMKEQDKNLEISALKRELETVKRTYEVQFSQLEEAKGHEAELTQKVQEYEQKLEELRNKAEKMQQEAKAAYEEEIVRLMKEQEDKNLEISVLKRELETAKRTYEVHFSKLEEEAKGAKAELTQQAQEYENQLEKLKNKVEKIKEEIDSLTKEQEDKNLEISALKQELETTKNTYEVQCSRLVTEVKDAKAELIQKSQAYEHRLEELRKETEKIREEEKRADENVIMRLMKEQEDKNLEISSLKQELETSKRTYQVQYSQFEGKAKNAKAEFEQKSQQYEHRLEELRNNVKELEVSSDSKDQKWKVKMNQLQTVVTFQFSSLQKLKLSWESIKQYVMKEQTVYAEDCDQLGVYLKPLLHAAENYHAVFAENQKMFNEIQELKGNIRVYCRIRPFLSGKKDNQSIVEHMGQNDLVVANPSKEGKEALRSFKFNKVFDHTTTQAEVYSDIQSLIRSVLDGYNVCIFAYGQTGSGKTYTMTGPNGATSETIGVNYRALNDLFAISTTRESLLDYEIGVQMVEIYNEQVRDLLTTDGSPKRYPFFFSTTLNTLFFA